MSRQFSKLVAKFMPSRKREKDASARFKKRLKNVLAVFFGLGFFSLTIHQSWTHILAGDQSAWLNWIGQPITWHSAFATEVLAAIAFIALSSKLGWSAFRKWTMERRRLTESRKREINQD